MFIIRKGYLWCWLACSESRDKNPALPTGSHYLWDPGGSRGTINVFSSKHVLALASQVDIIPPEKTEFGTGEMA